MLKAQRITRDNLEELKQRIDNSAIDEYFFDPEWVVGWYVILEDRFPPMLVSPTSFAEALEFVDPERVDAFTQVKKKSL